MSFGIYIFGFVLIIAGLAWGLVVAGVPHVYVAIACLVMLGIGIVSAVGKTRYKDPS